VQVAAVANAVAALYVDQNLKAREQQVTRAADFLRGELEEMTGRLMQQEKVIAEYNRRHAGELPQQVEVNLTRLERLNAQLELNGEKQLRAQERGRARPAAGRTAPAGGAVDDATRLQDLEAERSDLLLRCSPSHPDVLRVEAEIEALRSRAPGTRDAGGSPSPGSAGTAPDADASPGAHDLDALRQEESRLRRSIAEVEQSVVGAPERSQEYDTLTRDYHTTRDLYEGLVKRYEEALIASSQEHGQAGERFRVLEPAMPPSLPTGPDRRWLMLMAVLFSAGAAAGSMVLAERLDTSFHDLEALRAFTRVPVLGGIPRLDTRRDRARRLLLRGAAALLAAAVILATAGLGSRIARESDQVVTLLAGDRA
jgi:uncharacterized protein involved in exopolysaccharide biosynthesis